MSVAFGFVPRSPARLSSLHRLGWRQGIKSRGLVRRWATSTQTDEAAANRNLACSWLTATPEQLSPDDILSSFPNAASKSTSEYIPVFLFTPAFAQWADPHNTFLEQCMRRFHQNTLYRHAQRPVHSVVAIIDRLPNHGDESGRATELEGVSILLAKEGNVQGKAAARRQIRSTESEPPTLAFSFRKIVEHQGGLCKSSHKVGLRLANTIFMNGKDNTLLGTRWAYDSSSEKLQLDESADLSLCLVAVSPSNIGSSLELPLYPVGKRRKVITSMGNIVRQISKHADGRSDEPMPASSELEKELPRYIADNDIADQRISVWALIERSVESPYSKAKHSQSTLARSIKTGGKLHHVMSGGGGWGKKQGLLSLDPEMSFGESDDKSLKSLRQVLAPEDEGPAVADTILEMPSFIQDLSTLSQAAEPGDYVQFFASVEDPGTRTGSSDLSGRSKESLSFSFGVMSDADTPASQTEHKTLKVLPNYFGALSEKAITYSQPLDEPQVDPSETRTKIDVPGSRVTLVLK